ncbi:uncharacterized protein LOC118221695 [Anguilla anguilla]|uniref:uncharacterized protein LOC118221695 n=1 Tax=Anguilla anguilla TaxID=7936 RepID=UPI0015A96DD0|nr:uncharacterized protein LOC118221695 [Anguilla anguilla]
MELEELAEAVSQKLWLLQLTQLKEVGAEVKIQSGGVMSKRLLIKIISETMDNVIDDEDEEAAKAFLWKLLLLAQEKLDNLESLVIEIKPERVETVSPALLKEESVAELAEKNAQLQEENRRLKMNITASGQVFAPQNALSAATASRLPEVTIRKEFKISGQIGEKGQKDRLSYVNLMHQIDRGLNKRHSEAEVTEAVIRSISPGLSLRDMLEIKRDLTLPQLKTMLRAHFKEDSSTDLYDRLKNLTQDAKESPQKFLFGAIEIKERLLAASQEVGSEEQYSPELIQRKFLRSISTGLSSDHLKFQLKSYLDDEQVTDEVLIDRMNKAASVVEERQSKQRKSLGGKIAKVNKLQTEPQTSQHGQDAGEERVRVQEQSAEVVKQKNRKPPPPASSPRESDFREDLRLLREEVAEIRKSLTNPPPQYRQAKPGGRRACTACQQQGTAEQCRHCFKCGQTGHLSRGCLVQKRPAANPDSAKVTIETNIPPTSPVSSQSATAEEMHKLLRNRIRQLEMEVERNMKTGSTEVATYASHLSLPRQAKLTALIGKKCMVDCSLEGVATQALWDTGSQVTIINEKWRKSHLPHIQLRSTDEILGENGTIVGRAVNDTPIPFAGWVELQFKLRADGSPQPELLVPVLVSSEPGVAELPIIGYNVIEHLVMDGMEQHPEVTPRVVREAFFIDCNRASVLIRLVQSCDHNEKEGIVRVARQKTVIPAGQTREVTCSVRTGPLSTKQEVLDERHDAPVDC